MILSLLLAANFAHADQVFYSFSSIATPKYPKNFQHFDYVNPDAPKGGKMRFSTPTNFDSLNPYILKGLADSSISLTLTSLFSTSLDEKATYYPYAAENFEIADDKSYVMVNIFDKATFHDGSPITAEDLQFTIEILRSDAIASYKALLKEVEKVEIISEKKAKYYLDANKSQVIELIISLPIFSKKSLQGIKFAEFSDKPIMGSGAYKVKKYDFGKYITYERIKNHWSENLPSQKGSGNFDELKYLVIVDPQQDQQAFLEGAFDFKEEAYSKIWATGYNVEKVKNGTIRKELWQNGNPPNLQFLALNLRRADMQDLNFRKALELAFDFDQLNKNAFYELYKRSSSVYQNTKFQAQGLPSAEELRILETYRSDLIPEVFTKEYHTTSTNADPLIKRQNLIRAKQLLLDAGYTYKKDKLISPYTKQPVELITINYSNAFDRIFALYSQDLAKLGISLINRAFDTTTFSSKMNNFEYDLVYAAFLSPPIPGDLEKLLWHSSGDVKGGMNSVGLRNKVVDELVAKLNHVQTIADKTPLAKSLDRVLLSNYYIIPLYYSPYDRLALWDKFEMPKIKPKYSVGVLTWWTRPTSSPAQ